MTTPNAYERKKRSERITVDTLVAHLGMRERCTITPRETPDFRVLDTVTNNALGVEVTQFHTDDVLRQREGAWNTLRKLIFSRLKSRKSLHGLAIRFFLCDPPTAPSAHESRGFVDQLMTLLQDNPVHPESPTALSTSSGLACYPLLARHLRRIQLARYEHVGALYPHSSLDSGWTALRKDDLVSIAQEKATRYRGGHSFAELWLSITEGGTISQMYGGLGEQESRILAECTGEFRKLPFDKVFVVDGNMGVLQWSRNSGVRFFSSLIRPSFS